MKVRYFRDVRKINVMRYSRKLKSLFLLVPGAKPVLLIKVLVNVENNQIKLCDFGGFNENKK